MPKKSPYYNPKEDLLITHSNLPHWNQQQKIYAVTFRLYDALPHKVIQSYQEEWEQRKDKSTKDDHSEREAWMHKRMMEYLDAGYGACWLRDEAVRRIVASAFNYTNTHLARIHAYVIMPNHVHAVIETQPGVTIQCVLKRLKRFTAWKINQYLGRTGRVWQREYFDRIVRSNAHYERAKQYIISNPKHCQSGEFTLWLRSNS